MNFPKLRQISLSQHTQSVFGGYRHTSAAVEGEWYDMTNMSAAHYPALGTRLPRGLYATAPQGAGLARYDALCYVDGTRLFVDGYPVEMDLAVDGSLKTLTRMGSYLIILPDKRYLNLADFSDKGEIEASITVHACTLSPCRADGTAYESVISTSTAPEAGDADTVWLDTSASPAVLRQYAPSTGVWCEVERPLVRLGATGLGLPFSVGDGVTFSGLPVPLDGTHCVVAREKDALVIEGSAIAPTTLTGNITAVRRMPDMDHIVEAGNRLWGCRYGMGADGKVINELYASALGDFRNWQVFSGLSTDSYAAGVGSDGAFTGAITYQGTPIFFKEHYMHRVYGTTPDSFRVVSTPCRGVARECARSLCVVDEVLYYLADEGVCAFDGSQPQLVSAALGNERYTSAAAGARNGSYYISMRSERTDAWHLFVLDTARGLWHREDGTHARCFCAVGDELYFLDEAGRILTVSGKGTPAEGAIEFRALSGVIGLWSATGRVLQRLHVRVQVPRGAMLRVLVQYDSEGEYQEVFCTKGSGLRTITAVIRPQRCDHFRLLLCGKGDVRVHSITRYEGRAGDK